MTKKITTFFTDSGTPKTGLSATIRIRILSTNALVVTDAAMSEVGDGFYSYEFTAYDEDEEYSIRCDGSATLTDDGERYTYAGNESYVEDIWDAQTTDHQVAGSMGDAIRGSAGVLVGSNGGSRFITQQEALVIAEKVWQVMLTNDQNAKEVLLSRSDFNVIRDEVILKDKIVIPVQIDYSKDIGIIASGMTSIFDQIKAVAMKPVPEVNVPKSLLSDINSLAKTVDKAMLKLDSTIAETIIGATGGFADIGDEIKKKMDSMKFQLSSTNIDLSRAGELASAFETLKDSLTILMSLADKMSGDTEARRMLKKSLIQMSTIKFNMLDSRYKK